MFFPRNTFHKYKVEEVVELAKIYNYLFKSFDLANLKSFSIQRSDYASKLRSS